MRDDVVATAGQTVRVEIPGTDRVYTLRAPTFGEVGGMAARQAGAPAPSDAVFVDALREAIDAAPMEDAAKAEHRAAIDAAEDAVDALDSLYAVHGVDRSGWSAEAKREIADADRAYRSARKRRERAEWAVRDSAPLADLRRHQMDTGRREQIDLLILCLCGDGAPMDAAAVSALPAGDVMVIYQRALALMRPTPAAEKN